MPCSGIAHRIRTGCFHPTLIEILKRKTAITRSGRYTPFSNWDSFTDLSYRLVIATVCSLCFLVGVKCALLLDERGWFIDAVTEWFSGGVGKDSCLDYFPVYRSDTAVVQETTHFAPFCVEDQLLRSGDVETNPGPPKQDTYRQTRLNSGTANRRNSVETSGNPGTSDSASSSSSAPSPGENVDSPVMRMLAQMNSNFEVLKADMKEMKDCQQNIRSDVSFLKENVEDMRRENAELREENRVLRERVEALEMKTDDLECRSKRSNILFYGLKRKDKETGQECENVVQELIREKMELTDCVQFDRVHRLSNKPDSPIIAKCTFYKDKERIMRAKGKLKGSNVFVGEDFSVRVRELRKRLNVHLKKARKDGKRATMVFDHLVIDGKKYGVDESDRLKELK